MGKIKLNPEILKTKVVNIRKLTSVHLEKTVSGTETFDSTTLHICLDFGDGKQNTFTASIPEGEEVYFTISISNGIVDLVIRQEDVILWEKENIKPNSEESGSFSVPTSKDVIFIVNRHNETDDISFVCSYSY